MKLKITYKKLKDVYKREFEEVIKEMEKFRDNTEVDNIVEFEVPLSPLPLLSLIQGGLKTKTYLVRSSKPSDYKNLPPGILFDPLPGFLDSKCPRGTVYNKSNPPISISEYISITPSILGRIKYVIYKIKEIRDKLDPVMVRLSKNSGEA